MRQNTNGVVTGYHRHRMQPRCCSASACGSSFDHIKINGGPRPGISRLDARLLFLFQRWQTRCRGEKKKERKKSSRSSGRNVSRLSRKGAMLWSFSKLEITERTVRTGHTNYWLIIWFTQYVHASVMISGALSLSLSTLVANRISVWHATREDA